MVLRKGFDTSVFFDFSYIERKLGSAFLAKRKTWFNIRKETDVCAERHGSFLFLCIQQDRSRASFLYQEGFLSNNHHDNVIASDL